MTTYLIFRYNRYNGSATVYSGLEVSPFFQPTIGDEEITGISEEIGEDSIIVVLDVTDQNCIVLPEISNEKLDGTSVDQDLGTDENAPIVINDVCNTTSPVVASSHDKPIIVHDSSDEDANNCDSDGDVVFLGEAKVEFSSQKPIGKTETDSSSNAVKLEPSSPSPKSIEKADFDCFFEYLCHHVSCYGIRGRHSWRNSD